MPRLRRLHLSAFFSCPTAEQLAAWVDGGLEGLERTTVEQHLLRCDQCRELVTEVIGMYVDLESGSDAA